MKNRPEMPKSPVLIICQGDYGLFQCSVPCHNKTYDNEDIIRSMYERQKDMMVPSELVPKCPECGKPMTMNLRADDTFVEDENWHRACEKYNAFISARRNTNILYLELGVGFNTPAIIKYPFWKMTSMNPNAVYACVNCGEAVFPDEITDQTIYINGDIDNVLNLLYPNML